MKDLACFNKALLSKWAWKAVVGKDDLWLEIILSSIGRRNGRLSGVDLLRQNRSISGWWSDVLSSLADEKGDWFECNLRRIVGNGERTSFWMDIWIGNANLKSLFPRFFNRCLEKNCSVARAGQWEGDRWMWKVGWRREVRECEIPQLNELLSLIECRKSFSNQSDHWKWESEKSGMFSVRSSYMLLLNRKFEASQSLAKMCSSLWNNFAVMKAKATAWRVLFQKIATKAALQRRGVIPHNVSTACAVCGSSEESVEHLFFECRYARELWGSCLDWIGVYVPLSISAQANFTQFCYLLKGKPKRKFLATLWVCVVWSIWKVRNAIIFNEGQWLLERILGDIKSFMWVWVKSGSSLPEPRKSFRDWSSCPW